MAVQPIDMPTRRYKTCRYLRIELYIPRCEQVYIKLTINLHEELRKVESNLRHYLLQSYFAVLVCMHTQTRARATREKHVCKIHMRLKLPLSYVRIPYDYGVLTH